MTESATSQRLEGLAAGGNRRPQRRLLRFSLASVLLLMIPLGLGFLYLRKYLGGRPVEWVSYSAAKLDHRLQEGRTALLVFGGDWDTTAPLYYYQAAIETPRVHQWIRSHDVIPMRADWIKDRAEVSAALAALDGESIPVVAVYPASGDRPIVVAGEITEERILEALQNAERRR